MKPVRLLPLLAVAAVCLFALKLAGLMVGDGYMLSGTAPAGAQAETPQAEQATPPEPAATENEAPPDEGPAGAERPNDARAEGGNISVPEADTSGRAAVGAEKDILKSLANRRKALDQRARELELRENLIKVAENRVEMRIRELKEIEQRIEGSLTKQDEERDAEYEKLVSLYSKMKPKDAARIFERMEVGILAGLIRRMNARTVSPILAEMDPVMAKRVTMEIASTQEKPTGALQSLPKITGRNPG